ncbi:hypothetical protein [Pelagicoccus albus]|uniref:Uncharacterized protein n=1 Tax=Pelagicoccus albus TaxID=415222 RepID=A0A7X1BBW2_9BACT|nr:hypothetical protein [Pelagicoccus albus]MBC2608188.1 hypothetical protein [Pelagicoccus albus]
MKILVRYASYVLLLLLLCNQSKGSDQNVILSGTASSDGSSEVAKWRTSGGREMVSAQPKRLSEFHWNAHFHILRASPGFWTVYYFADEYKSKERPFDVSDSGPIAGAMGACLLFLAILGKQAFRE